VLADGDSVVTVDDDESVAVWSLARRTWIRTLLPPGDYRSVRVSADRRTVVVASAPGAVIVDGLSGQPHPLLQMANALSISPDGQNLVAGSDTGDITVWDVGSGTRRGVGRRHTGLVRDAVWSPPSSTISMMWPNFTPARGLALSTCSGLRFSLPVMTA